MRAAVAGGVGGGGCGVRCLLSCLASRCFACVLRFSASVLTFLECATGRFRMPRQRAIARVCVCATNVFSHPCCFASRSQVFPATLVVSNCFYPISALSTRWGKSYTLQPHAPLCRTLTGRRYSPPGVFDTYRVPTAASRCFRCFSLLLLSLAACQLLLLAVYSLIRILTRPAAPRCFSQWLRLSCSSLLHVATP